MDVCPVTVTGFMPGRGLALEVGWTQTDWQRRLGNRPSQLGNQNSEREGVHPSFAPSAIGPGNLSQFGRTEPLESMAGILMSKQVRDLAQVRPLEMAALDL